MTVAPTHLIGKLLIANRGEIACRIISTARRMGIGTVAVYSDADRDALHVSMADEAVHVGPAAARESYLRGDRIIEAARLTGATAIHPGYGFLSENDAFAEACADAGLIFIGPPVAAIRAMGSKSAAKAIMAGSAVPMVPGYHGDAQDENTLSAEAGRIGFPLLVKATAGGGGKGMRIVAEASGLGEAVTSAKREAAAAFGDDRVLLERYVQNPRHIEVQVFGDHHGNVVSLFERECTLQRRHQKVVEEAPSATLSEADREGICAAARAAASAVGYVGAGTVEFVADDDGFYFIEMNTRLQVEHPVTEAITGLDLVEWQLRVAAGEPLPLAQGEIARRGHAFEVRIYAEDPESGFLPSIGPLKRWRMPETGEGIRVDSGFREGDRITPFYDPMLAKLIVHGADRQQALGRMAAALDECQVTGVKTNLAFLKALVTHKDVVRGAMDTGFIERHLGTLTHPASPHALDIAAAAAAILIAGEPTSGHPSPWDAGDGWMMAGMRKRTLALSTAADSFDAAITYTRKGLTLDTMGEAGPLSFSRRGDGLLDVQFAGRKESVHASVDGATIAIVTPRGRQIFHLKDPFEAEEAELHSGGQIRAPMPGSIRQILAAPGSDLKRGEPILVMEAMKMEHTLRAPADGRLVAVKFPVGALVDEGAELAEFEAAVPAGGR